MRLKICDSHLTSKVANKCPISSPAVLCCESLVSVKENPDRKKIAKTKKPGVAKPQKSIFFS